jgi:signal transduction histidine kinase
MEVNHFMPASLQGKPWLASLVLGLLAVSCAALGVLQYFQLAKVSEAERDRLRFGLQSQINAAEITNSAATLMPVVLPDGDAAREQAYLAAYRRWRQTTAFPGIFRRIVRLLPNGPAGELRLLDVEGSRFETVPWPEAWGRVRANLAGKIADGRLLGPLSLGEPLLLELPRFATPAFRRASGGRDLEEWLFLELDPDYASQRLLASLVRAHLSYQGELEYQVHVVTGGPQPRDIYRTGGAIAPPDAEASVPILDLQFERIARGGSFNIAPVPAPPPGARAEDLRPPRGRWMLFARHEKGSLETVAQQAQWRNLAMTAAILLLIFLTSAAFVRFNRNAQRLAELQIEFISGVSHELRTPLAVIASAAFNIKRGVVKDPSQMKSYGQLIHKEAERLTAIVEQVLHFARSRSTAALAHEEPVAVGRVIENAMESTAEAVSLSGCRLEVEMDSDLPQVLGDEVALTQAVQNLIANAAKYGAEGGWIGVAARLLYHKGKEQVEIIVSDRGPGIAPGEREQIFAPFFRGNKAVADQIHGTGLGLHLVKKIVEAHGGRVTVDSQPGAGAAFTIRIPALAVEQPHELTHSSR